MKIISVACIFPTLLVVGILAQDCPGCTKPPAQVFDAGRIYVDKYVNNINTFCPIALVNNTNDAACIACKCAMNQLCYAWAAPNVITLWDTCALGSGGKITAKNVGTAIDGCNQNAPALINKTGVQQTTQCQTWIDTYINSGSIASATFMPVATAVAALMLLAMTIA